MRASEFVTEEAKAAKYNGLLMKYAFNDNALIIKAFTKEGPVAFVKFVKENKELYPQNLWVNDEHRSRGIAKSMYDYLKSQGFIINRSHDQTKAGAGFWDKHRGEDAYVWEAFDQPYSIKWEKSEYGDYDAMAKLPDGTPLTVMFDHTEPDEVTITFWRNNNLELTGEGDAQRVFATVLHAIQEFLKIEQPANIKFSASKDVEPGQNAMSRAKLYDKLVKRYAQQWGYDSHSVDHGDGIMYELSKIKEEVDEEIIDEMPLPADWDPQQMRQQGTTFKSRLAYALERAKKLGTGSSRVATIIEYQGRPTVLKIAKNQKGLAQNSVEADILSDGYASQLGILIPLIDYDEQNREPSWIHTEMATKASEKQLCALMKCDNLNQLVNMAWAITGKKKYVGNYETYKSHLIQTGHSEQDIDTMTEYANILADLNSSFDVELGDFTRAANWGIYKGKPVIVDVGFNSNVLNQYYKR